MDLLLLKITYYGPTYLVHNFHYDTCVLGYKDWDAEELHGRNIAEEREGEKEETDYYLMEWKQRS